MIRVELSLDARGLLSELRASGHSGLGQRDAKLVCAAATALMRSAYSALDSKIGIEISGEAPQEGELWFKVDNVGPDLADWLRGCTDFLVAGLGDLTREYPAEIELQVKDVSRA